MTSEVLRSLAGTLRGSVRGSVRVRLAGRASSLVVIPAALPSVVSGLKQGWAFAWRSLMAAELISLIPGHVGIGQLLSSSGEQLDFVVTDRGEVILRPANVDVRELRGLLKRLRRRNVTVERMNAAILRPHRNKA